MIKKETVFLLRAFGDFVIALNMVKSSKKISTVEFIASRHLEALYHAIPAAFLPADVKISFHDFTISKNIFRCFTNRYFFDTNTVKELFSLRTCVQEIKRRNGEKKPLNLYLEQKRRRLWPTFFAGYPFKYIVDRGNVYQSYALFFQSSFTDQENFIFDTRKRGLHILVVPNARIKSREIPPEIVEKINTTYQPVAALVRTAFFTSAPDDYPGTKVLYHDFKELVTLIEDADLVIGSDSMPIHLCQLLKKPHYILHPAKVKDQFFTPYALKHRCHFSFEEIATRQSFLPNDKS